jgi:hypothetical protein
VIVRDCGILRMKEVDKIALLSLCDRSYISQCESIEDYLNFSLKGMEGVETPLEEFRLLAWDYIWEATKCRMLFKQYKDGEVSIKPFLNTGTPTITKHRRAYEHSLRKLLDIDNHVEDTRRDLKGKGWSASPK